MCLAVYLASDRSLPLVEQAAFLVRPLERREAGVRRHFSKPHIYYIGAYTGCGCGFIPDDPSEAAQRAETIAQFVAYLDREVPELQLELFVCWEGAQAKTPVHRLRLTRDQLAGRAEWCEELAFTLVERAA
jgi:hypothetical protein